MRNLRTVQAAKNRLSRQLGTNGNIVGIGVGEKDGDYVVRVSVLVPDDEIPPLVGTVPVVTEVSAQPKARTRAAARARAS